MPIIKRPVAPTPASAGQAAHQVQAGQARHIVAPNILNSGRAKPDPKMGAAPGGVTPGEPMSFKTHALVGRRQADGHLLLIESWDYCPTQQQLEKAKKDTKYPYVQFALVNAVGVWDAVEKKNEPLWTNRA